MKVKAASLVRLLARWLIHRADQLDPAGSASWALEPVSTDTFTATSGTNYRLVYRDSSPQS